MKDRFKFRFWHKPTNKMLDCYGFNEHSTFANTLDGIGTEYNPCATKDCELMQCTGLKDKNGKMIYEGDIIEAKHKPDREGWYCVYRGIVKYDNKKCQYVINSNHHKVLNENKLIKSDLNTDTSFNWFDWFEVIGNIYENPELLEVEQ